MNQSLNREMTFTTTHNLCPLGSLLMEFTNAWTEGDGERILRCWKFFLLHFYKDGGTKCALESLTLQFNCSPYHPRLQIKIVYSKGGLGRNIPCDLFNEHVNRIFKKAVGNMGSNFTEHSTTRVARSVTLLEMLARRMDKQCAIPPETTAHCTRSNEHDIMYNKL